MKRLLLLAWLFIIGGIVTGQTDSLAMMATELEALTAQVRDLESTRDKFLYVLGIISLVYAVLLFIGAKTIIGHKLKEIITERLAFKLQVPTAVLEEALIDLSGNYGAKHNKQILIISEESGQVDGIRRLLLKGGFDRNNIFFAGIKETIDPTQKDIILFNDNIDSVLETADLKTVIKENRKKIKTYFYFGAQEKLSLKDIQREYQVNITGANFPDTLVKNLVNALKSYT